MGALLTCAATNLCECALCMGCNCFGSLVSATLGQAARMAHLLLYISIFVLAVVLGNTYQDHLVGTSTFTVAYYVKIPNSLNIQTLTAGCDPLYLHQCVANQVIYRASCALTFFFMIMAVIATLSDGINKGMCGLKVIGVFGAFIAFWYGNNDFFSGFAEDIVEADYLARREEFFDLLKTHDPKQGMMDRLFRPQWPQRKLPTT